MLEYNVKPKIFARMRSIVFFVEIRLNSAALVIMFIGEASPVSSPDTTEKNMHLSVRRASSEIAALAREKHIESTTATHIDIYIVHE